MVLHRYNSGESFGSKDIFYEDATAALEKKYDLVVSSGALHYSEKWQETLGQLSKASLKYLFISRLLVTQNAPSFVFIQKYYWNKTDYKMEVVGWVMNRDELLECANKAGMKLVRVADPEPVFIHKAPKGMIEERGFLFTSS